MATSLVNSKVRSFTVWTFQSDSHSNVNLQLSCTKQILWRRSADRLERFFSGWYSDKHIRLRFRLAVYFSADFRRTEIRRLIQISAAAEGSSRVTSGVTFLASICLLMQLISGCFYRYYTVSKKTTLFVTSITLSNVDRCHWFFRCCDYTQMWKWICHIT